MKSHGLIGRIACLGAIGLVQAEAESILFNASFILFTLFHTV